MLYESILTQRSNWWFQNMAMTVTTSFVGKKQILPVFLKGKKQTSMRPWPHSHSCSRIGDNKLIQMCGFIVTSKGFWVAAVEPSAQLRGRIRLNLGILWGQPPKGRGVWLWMACWAGLIALLCCWATWKLFSLLFQLKVAYLSPMVLIYSTSKIGGKERQERKG